RRGRCSSVTDERHVELLVRDVAISVDREHRYDANREIVAAVAAHPDELLPRLEAHRRGSAVVVHVLDQRVRARDDVARTARAGAADALEVEVLHDVDLTARARRGA